MLSSMEGTAEKTSPSQKISFKPLLFWIFLVVPWLAFYLMVIGVTNSLLEQNYLGADTSGYLFLWLIELGGWVVLTVYSAIMVIVGLWRYRREAVKTLIAHALILVLVIGTLFGYHSFLRPALKRRVDCTKMELGNSQDRCYFRIAQAQCDPTLCNKMSNPGNMRHCFSDLRCDFAFKKKDAEKDEEKLIARAKEYYQANPKIRIEDFTNTYNSISDYLSQTPDIPHSVENWSAEEIFSSGNPVTGLHPLGTYYAGRYVSEWSLYVHFDVETMEPIETTLHDRAAYSFHQKGGGYFEPIMRY